MVDKRKTLNEPKPSRAVMLLEILKDGEEIVTDDGSKWWISPFYIPDVCIWIPTATIVVSQNSDDPTFPYVLHNRDENESVNAALLS